MDKGIKLLIVDREFDESLVALYLCDDSNCVKIPPNILHLLRCNKQKFLRQLLGDNLFLIAKEVGILLFGNPINSKWLIPKVKTLITNVLVFKTRDSRRKYVIFTKYNIVLEGFKRLYSSNNKAAKQIRLWRFRNILRMLLDGSINFNELQQPYKTAVGIFLGVSRVPKVMQVGNRRFTAKIFDVAKIKSTLEVWRGAVQYPTEK